MSNMLDHFFNTVGIIGMLTFLWAYFMLQKNLWKYDGLAYSAANLFGAICLITSLFWSWNLASFMLECAWLVISSYGIWKWWKNRPSEPEQP